MRLSISRSLITCHLDAPSARRVATSRRRERARASDRLARLAQAMISTSATVPRSNAITGRSCPSMVKNVPGATATRIGPRGSGSAAASREAITERSLSTEDVEPRSGNRPSTRSQVFLRS
jgi:hypothetical protein